MITRIGLTVVAVCSVMVIGGPVASADAAQDQQFLDLVHSNGIAGQDDSLLAFAQEYCSPTPPAFLGTVGPLYGQGVWPSQIYTIKVAASRVYCPNRIATPIQAW